MADLRKFLNKESVMEYDRLAKILEEHFAGIDYGTEAESEGYIFTIGFYPETARYALQEWKNMKDGTVFIVNHPKTGNNWLYEITRYLLYMHDDEQMEIALGIPAFLSFLDFSDTKKFEILDQIPLVRNIFRTHIPEALFDLEKLKKKNGKVIYILRNPKDQLVSLYHFSQVPIYKYGGYPTDWNVFFHEYLQGKYHWWTKEGQWYLDNVLEWWKYKDDDDFLFVYYEDMKQDIRKEIRRMAAFLDVQMTDEKMEKVVRLTSFQAMHKKMDEVRKIFTRKGIVGGWKDMFTVAQSEMMDELIAKKLKGTGIKFTYQL